MNYELEKDEEASVRGLY